MTTAPQITDWKIQQLEDLTGKRYLITGGNSGIGLAAAAHLRQANPDVPASRLWSLSEDLLGVRFTINPT